MPGQSENGISPGVPVTLDFSRTDLTDSEGLKIVFSTKQRLKDQDTALLTVVPDSSAVGRVLEVSGFYTLVLIYSDISSALAAAATCELF